MSRKRKKKRYRGFWIYVKVQIFLMALVLGAVAYYYLAGYGREVQELKESALEKVNSSTEETFRANQTSLVYDANGELISVLKGEKDVYYLEYENIPPSFISAIVSIEDKKFYKHSGIDYKAIVRAVIAMLRDGEVTQGGSTITQQLARTIYLNTEKSWQRKVEEMFIALELEKRYTKNQIMEFYLNNIYFANGYYGIQAASQGYFGEDAVELSLSQVAYLCAIPNSPSYYDPRKNLENAIKRRNLILYNMWEDGLIGDVMYEEAKAEEITVESGKTIHNNYLETYTYHCAVKELMKARGFEFRTTFSGEEERAIYEDAYDTLYQECKKSLYTAGYRIYTSLDMTAQDKLQASVDDVLKDYKEKNEEGIYELQSGAVCIDNHTGRVTAIVGGRSQKLEGYTLNRGYQSYRQPGSAIKPLIVYAPQLERGYTADSIVVDQEIADGPKQSYYRGEMTLRTAVEESVNSVAWQLFEELTPEVGLAYLEKMNFSKLSGEDYRLPSSLGGFTTGVSPLEMAAAYAALENDGYYREPTCIVRITTADGATIVETERESIQVYRESAARAMTDILTGVLSEGTAKGWAIEGMPCAGKTGTTNENKDGWFVGYTPYYTTSVWVGYDMPKELNGLQGATYPAEIWNSFMGKIHEGLERTEFLEPLE